MSRSGAAESSSDQSDLSPFDLQNSRLWTAISQRVMTLFRAGKLQRT